MTWIQTHTGKRFDFEKIDPQNIDIYDIATSLARLPRFCGHSPFKWTVGQHSIEICRAMGREGEHRDIQLAGLLHDAAEAYTNDIVRPFKHMLPELQEAEKRIERAIEKRFGMVEGILDLYVIKEWDRAMLATEVREFGWDWPDVPLPDPIDGVHFNPNQRSLEVRETFVKLFHRLSGEPGAVSKFEIWAEGYQITGGRGKAELLGTSWGKSFGDAVRRLVATLPESDASLYKERTDGTWTYWGCKLFNNRYDAQRSFG